MIKNTTGSNRLLDVLLLAVIALVVYWPLTFSVFSLKHDALSYFLPYRYQVSECIQNGYFPWWSPYLYTGLPLHADMQSGVWNPIVMLISTLTTYNMTILQWETLIYIILGGIGFYRLCSHFSGDSRVQLLMGMCYMCSGFIIDSASFIPWITSAAYIPFVFHYFLELHSTFKWSDAMKLGLASALLFLSGYPSFFIFTIYIISIITVATLLIELVKKQFSAVFYIRLMASALITVLICSPALFSYIEFFPYYQRGSGASLEQAQINPFSFQNTISYFFPPASYGQDSGNDISSRNAYIGLLPLIFLVFLFRKRINKKELILALVTILSFLFSLGDATPVRELAYEFLPFMDSFRHPGSMRLFTGAGLLLLAAAGMQVYFDRPDLKFTRKVSLVLLALSAIMVVYSFTALWELGTGISISRETIRNMVQNTGWKFWLLMSACIQLIFLLIFFFKTRINLVAFSFFNFFVLTLICMPFTMFSMQTSRQVNQFIDSFEKGFPSEKAMENVMDHSEDSSMISVSGYIPFYQKKISLQDHFISPTINSAYHDFIQNPEQKNQVAMHPFIRTDSGRAILNRMSPSLILITVENQTPSDLHIVQQYHHNWKAAANKLPVVIKKDQQAFMKISLPAGRSHIRLQYRSEKILTLYFISLLVFLTALVLVIYFRRNESKKH